jgi:hypothetical protein
MDGPIEPPLNIYDGACHCGNFRFTLKLPESKSSTSCNCSICSKLGVLWVKPGSIHDLEIQTSEEMLSTYQFGNKVMKHKVRHELNPSGCTMSTMAVMLVPLSSFAPPVAPRYCPGWMIHLCS